VQGAALGSIFLLGSVVSVVTAPLMGSYSDSCEHSAGLNAEQ
jgi:Na+/melibiose symporter-like transporter